MKRGEILLVEGVIRDFPAINRDMQDRKYWLEIMSVSPGSNGEPRVDGGSSSPAQERFLKAMDERYFRKLQRIVDTFYPAYRELTPPESRVVALYYWDDMEIAEMTIELDFSYRYIQRLKAAALYKLKRACMDIISDVDAWREREHNELSKAIRLLYSA